MENLQHQNVQTERRVMSRIDAALRINYQIISDDVALNDPYDPNFVRILSLFNQKLNLITGSLYDTIVQTMLPTPEHVNFSESGLSFYSEKQIQDGTYIHLTLSHPENFFHIAAIAQVEHTLLPCTRKIVSNWPTVFL